MYQKQLEVAIEAAKAAQAIIMSYYKNDFDIEVKEDNSPVTTADLKADIAIRKVLQRSFPTYAILSEESLDDKQRLNNDFVFIVDPLDGTRDFIHRTDEFAINIALSYRHEIVMGIIFAPVSGDVYYALQGEGAYLLRHGVKHPLHVSDRSEQLIMLVSRHHGSKKEAAKIKKYGPRLAKTLTIGSSLKGCYIASGEADLFFRYSDGTKEWDTASQDLIVHEAGGFFLKPNGERYTYNRNDVVNREGYVITNRKDNIL